MLLAIPCPGWWTLLNTKEVQPGECLIRPQRRRHECAKNRPHKAHARRIDLQATSFEEFPYHDRLDVARENIKAGPRPIEYEDFLGRVSESLEETEETPVEADDSDVAAAPVSAAEPPSPVPQTLAKVTIPRAALHQYTRAESPK